MLPDSRTPLTLLGGLTPAQFMRRHWQKKPLLVRQAVADAGRLGDVMALWNLAAHEDVESRLIRGPRSATGPRPAGWRMRQGPFSRRALPPRSQPDWTLLVQGVDLHWPEAHELLQRFRFVPDARLDDVMISYATDGGGVGPHFDSYDVFLLQTRGRRRWRISDQRDLSLQPDMPLKILAHFEPVQEWVLEPGDMLYLPPRYAHEGVALGECMTCSVGFRSPARSELARELLLRMADHADDEQDTAPGGRYRDPGQPPVADPARLPPALLDFARGALQHLLSQPDALALSLGEYLTEPKPRVPFHDRPDVPTGAGQGMGAGDWVLHRATRMLYDARHLYLNGESFRVSGTDATLLRRLADRRRLRAAEAARLSPDAAAALQGWADAGWVQRD